MTKSSKSDARGAASERFSELSRVFHTCLPNLYGWFGSQAEDAISLRVKCRGTDDWIAIIKRYGDDGGPEVCFGVGFDFLSAVLNANSSMAGQRWRPDRPYVPDGSS